MIGSLRSEMETRSTTPFRLVVLLSGVVVCLALAAPAQATMVPQPSPLDAKAFRHPDLYIPSLERPVSELPGIGARALDLVGLDVRADQGFYDWRAGRWGSLILSQPLVPGDGQGNTLGAAQTVNEAQVWQALSSYLTLHEQELRVDRSELGAPSIGIQEGGNIIQVHVPRVVDGIPVRDSGLSAFINHGNLILLGLQNWGTLDATPNRALTYAQAQGVVVAHVQPFVISGYRGEGHLELIPMARGTDLAAAAAGAGYSYRLAWVVAADVKDSVGTWEALVDATSGELIAFEDKNDYAVRRVMGGVYPVSNDQRPPDGIEQAGWPMPYANVTGAATTFTTTGGIVKACEAGSISTTLSGQFIRIADTCGAINEPSPAGNLDLGFGPNPLDTDCVVPVGHTAGDTKSARTGFYELNRINEAAKPYLPTNTWLQGQLTSNMNLNQVCNAFWNGATVNFFRSSAACRNTGEIAAVFDHEWGHGLDDNGVNGNISQPQEAIADIDAATRLNTSCIGRGFWKNQVCGGYGDPCIGTPATGCTGVRDVDFAQHVSGLPHGISWILSNCSGGGAGPCGREVHCEGVSMGEVGWDLQARDLRGAPYNFDENTALELNTRFWILGQQTAVSYYTCTPTGGGCNATSGYMLLLGVDDDNGNLNDGTPHMTAIFNAFNRHQMQCATPTVVDSGCAAGPTTAPTVVATPSAGGVDLSWGAVPGAGNYYVYRAEGVNGCSFGKIKAGQTNGTTWSDSGLLDGRPYNYAVLPVGTNSSCFGRMSTCAPVTPLAAADPCAVTNASVSFVSPFTEVAEGGVNATIVVAVTTNNGQPTIAPLTVDFATVNGTATAPADYTSTSGTMSFPTGTASGATQNIVVPIIQDIIDEPNEDFLVVLSNVAGGVISPNVSHRVTIIDDDVPVELQSIVIE